MAVKGGQKKQVVIISHFTQAETAVMVGFIAREFDLFFKTPEVYSGVFPDDRIKWSEALYFSLKYTEAFDVYGINVNREDSTRENFYGVSEKNANDVARILEKVDPDVCIFNCEKKWSDPLLEYCKKAGINSIWYNNESKLIRSAGFASAVISPTNTLTKKVAEKYPGQFVVTLKATATKLNVERWKTLVILAAATTPPRLTSRITEELPNPTTNKSFWSGLEEKAATRKKRRKAKS